MSLLESATEYISSSISSNSAAADAKMNTDGSRSSDRSERVDMALVREALKSLRREHSADMDRIRAELLFADEDNHRLKQRLAAQAEEFTSIRLRLEEMSKDSSSKHQEELNKIVAEQLEREDREKQEMERENKAALQRQAEEHVREMVKVH